MAANLADIVRIVNTCSNNLIELHNTRPGDIERALAGELEPDEEVASGATQLQILAPLSPTSHAMLTGR